MTNKKCFKCQIEKDADAFAKDKSRHDGLCHKCKQCKAISEKLRSRLTTYRSGRSAQVRKYESQNPHVRKVWNALRTARSNGTVTPWPTCAVPECTCEKVHAHHADYSRPLDVVWLCPKHHKAAHLAHL